MSSKQTFSDKFKILDRRILSNGDNTDRQLIAMVFLLLAFGLVMVYSSSVALAGTKMGDATHFLNRQALFACIGGVSAWIVCRVPLYFWQKASWWIWGITIVLLIAVLFIGKETKGASRWIPIGPFHIQPAELFKLAVIIYLSAFFLRRADVLKKFNRIVWSAVPVGIGIGLLGFQPDFGSMMLVFGIALGMLFLVGLPVRWFLASMLFCFITAVTLISVSPYRQQRIITFLDPFQDPYGKGYQIIHSMLGIRRGGWFGEGLGNSIEKYLFLPEAHNDFIMAIIGEEFGLFAIAVLTGCYIWLVLRAFSIGKLAQDTGNFFGAYIAKGIALWIFFQSFFAIAVNTGAMPTKGMPLPFISYGGSSLITMLLAVGLLLRVDFEVRQAKRGFYVKTYRPDTAGGRPTGTQS